jgi:FMN phosphatase YigB (HAD superfamily)
VSDAVELVITVEEMWASKPHAAPYQRAGERLGVPLQRITLIAAHGRDVLGATRRG